MIDAGEAIAAEAGARGLGDFEAAAVVADAEREMSPVESDLDKASG